MFDTVPQMKQRMALVLTHGQEWDHSADFWFISDMFLNCALCFFPHFAVLRLSYSRGCSIKKKKKRRCWENPSCPRWISQHCGRVKIVHSLLRVHFSFTLTSCRCFQGTSRQRERKASVLVGGCWLSCAIKWFSSDQPERSFCFLLICLCLCYQCWENGIILCRELADQYESYYDYRNLSKMRVSSRKP